MQNRFKTSKFNQIKNLVCIAIAMFVCFALNNISGIKCYFTASSTATNAFSIAGTYTVHFDANLGTGPMSDQVIFRDTNTSLKPNEFTRQDYLFKEWNTAANGTGTSYEDEESVINLAAANSSITLYAQWEEFLGVAMVNGQYYDTLQEAIDAVPKNNTKTTVTLLKDVNESVTVARNQNILFDLQNHTVTGVGPSGNKVHPTIENSGTVEIQNGTLTKIPSAQNAVIDNTATGTLKITGGSIIAVGSTKAQAIYNNGGRLEISGNAYISAESTNRSTVTNIAGGTVTVTGGTIISEHESAISSISVAGSAVGGLIVIGTEDSNVDTTTPVIQGYIYGINSAPVGVELYDGIIKGKTTAINNNAYIVDKETGCSLVHDTEVIGGETYKTMYLTQANTVTFDPNGGEVTPETKYVSIGDPIGQLPTPTKTGALFLGWFTDPVGGTQISENTLATGDDIFYAHWQEALTVTFNANGGTVTPSSKEVLSGQQIGDMPRPIRSRYRFDGWFTAASGGTQVTSSTVITQSMPLYAHWTASNAARVDGTEYATLQAAINAVPNGVQKTVELICDDSENVTVAAGQDIVFDFGNYVLFNSRSAPVIENNGSIQISNGTITSSVGYAAVNNYGSLDMSGGEIIATGNRQAIYNSGGTVVISGDAYLSSANLATDKDRGTVHNLDNGTVQIKGGTIIAEKINAVYNAAGTVTIGEDDGTVSTSTPSIRGAKNGIKTAAGATTNFYDGIVKVPTSQTLISGTIADKPTGYDFVTGTETIDGTAYKTTYLDVTP